MGKKKGKKYKKSAQKHPIGSVPVQHPGDTYEVSDGIRGEAGGSSKNRFILEKVLGIGGLCEVCSATDLLRVACGDKSPHVAIKRLLPQYAKEFKAQQLLVREFIVTRTLSHEGIIRFYDLHETKYGPVISMELLEGKLLSSLQLGIKEKILPIAQSLFKTLSVLHTSRVVHGDIKPGNLILEWNSRLVLFDFNTADAEPAVGAPSSAVTRSICAELNIPSFSPLYASPARLGGAPPMAADDIFSACCTLIELAEGLHPFNRKTSLESSESGSIKIELKYLPGKFQDLLKRGLSPEPGQRPAAQEFCSFFDNSGVSRSIFDRFSKWRSM